MKISLEKIQDNHIVISVPDNIPVEELDGWKIFTKELLLLAFENKRIGLVTIDPQSYSLGYEYDGHTNIIVNGKPVLINIIEKASVEMLHLIAACEEFNRGLLRIIQTIVISPADMTEENILAVISGNKNSVKPGPLLYFDDDGLIIHWIEDKPPLGEIRRILQLSQVQTIL